MNKHLYDIQAEKAILGSIIRDNDMLSLIVDKYSPDFFYSTQNKIIYKALVKMVLKNIKVDVVTLTSRLDDLDMLESVGGNSYVLGIYKDFGYSAFNIEHYANIVREKAIVRKIRSLSEDVLSQTEDIDTNSDDLLNTIQNNVHNINNNILDDTCKSTEQLTESIEDLLFNKEKRDKNLLGIKTGFKTLDKIVKMCPGDLILIAGRPSMGKTTFGLNVLNNIMNRDLAVGLFSMEMSKERIMLNVLGLRSRNTFDDLVSSSYSPSQKKIVTSHLKELGTKKLFIDDKTGLTTLQLKAKIKRLILEQDIKIAVIDYLQYIKSNSKSFSKADKFSEIVLDIKAIAKDLSIPIILICQFNREHEKENREPRLSDLGDTSALEQAADIIMFLYSLDKEEMEKDNMNLTLKLAKNKNGKRNVDLNLQFSKPIYKFYELMRGK